MGDAIEIAVADVPETAHDDGSLLEKVIENGVDASETKRRDGESERELIGI